MDYSFKPTAKKSLEKLDKEQSREILSLIDEVASQGISHEKVKMIKDRDGNWVYRLKVDGEHTNHRAFLDYIDGELKVLDILHRENAYEGDYGNF